MSLPGRLNPGGVRINGSDPGLSNRSCLIPIPLEITSVYRGGKERPIRQQGSKKP